jgi:hypothetical protein
LLWKRADHPTQEFEMPIVKKRLVQTFIMGDLADKFAVGPVILAGPGGFDGSWRAYIGVGRLFGRRRE